MSIAGLLVQATEHLRAGRFLDAEALYRQCLQTNDAERAAADAWHGLGLVALQTGQPDRALESFNRALNLRSEAGFHINRGLACLSLKRLPDAVEAFRAAVSLNPELAEARNNLANGLWESGQREEAAVHWREAVRHRPNYADARLNLAHALVEQEQFEAAHEHAQAAAEILPRSGRAQLLLGKALAGLRRHAESIEALHSAVQSEPAWAEAWGELGLALSRLGRHAEAESALENAVRHRPSDASLHNALATVQAKSGRLAEALQSLDEALRLRPDLAAAHHNCGQIRMEQRDFRAAVAAFREALKIDPNLREAYSQLALAYERQGDLDAAAACAKKAVARWPDDGAACAALGNVLAMRGDLAESQAAYEQAVRLRPHDVVAHGSLLCTLLYQPDLDDDALAAAHRDWVERHGRPPRLGPARDHDRDPDRPLRVGYISRDFGGHILTRFLVPIIVHHDRSQVQAHLFADLLHADALASSLRNYAAGWHSIAGLPDEAVAERVREEKIDLLVDLDGHCGSRLGVLARQPAPLLFSYLGYPSSTGLPIEHYRLTDAILDPPDEKPAVSGGEPVRLASGFSCFAPRLDAPPVSQPPCGVDGPVTFGSTHKLAKLNDRVLDVWAEILKAIPPSRLLLYRDTLRGEVAASVREQFRKRQIGEDRVEIRAAGPGEEYLKIYDEIDILLDAFPWSGHATACEALWQGVPVLTLKGSRYAGRMTASVLAQVGLSDWVATSTAEYVVLAQRRTADRVGLVELRSKLRERMRLSRACNGRSFTRELEEVYRLVWQRWLRKEK